MSIRVYGALSGLAALMALACSAPANALTMQECSAKYKAAQSAGTVKGMKWNDFRKAECGADAPATPAAVAPRTTGLTMQECSAKYKAAQSAGTLKGMKWNDFRKAECGADAAAAPAATAVAPRTTEPATRAAFGSAVFPRVISAKYANESAGKARMHTCLDQYNANKVSNGNGDLKWTQKGGGYYSQCNKRLTQQ